MDLPQLASEIQQLTQELNSWTSTFRLTLPSSESYLDLGCAVMGEESCTPIGSTDQPKKYPPGKNGSVYQFPNTYCGQESWSALYRIIQHSVSGCSILVHQAYPCRSLRRKATYHLCCQHGRKHEGISKVVMKDNCVGPSNVPHEHLKFVKNGTKSRGIVFFLHVFSVSIIIVKNNRKIIIDLLEILLIIKCKCSVLNLVISFKFSHKFSPKLFFPTPFRT